VWSGFGHRHPAGRELHNEISKTPLLLALLLPAAAMAQMQGMDMPEQFAFGQPAEESAATRTIHVEATDTMRLKFDSMRIRRGDVVKFVVRNSGQAPHEFAIGDESFRKEHLLEMRKQMAGMEHQDVNVLSLKGARLKRLSGALIRSRASPSCLPAMFQGTLKPACITGMSC
jgi:uncharacterized cupredoxin-like copper-binding protein